jgi:hypothetical protein
MHTKTYICPHISDGWVVTGCSCINMLVMTLYLYKSRFTKQDTAGALICQQTSSIWKLIM